MLKTLHIKSLFVGALLGFAGVLAGEGLAHADCDYPTAREACEDAAVADVDGCVRYELAHSEVYELAFALAEESCDYASQGWLESGLTEEQVGGYSGMYEACMRLSVPPMVLSPAQHYDTADGAFWRTVEQ